MKHISANGVGQKQSHAQLQEESEPKNTGGCCRTWLQESPCALCSPIPNTQDGAESGTQLLQDRNPPYSPPRLGRQAPFTNTEHKVAGRPKKQQQNSYPPHFIPSANRKRSFLPHSKPHRPTAASPSTSHTPRASTRFQGHKPQQNSPKAPRGPTPPAGLCCSATILRTAAGGLCWHGNVPLQDETGGWGGVPSMLHIRLEKPTAELDQRRRNAPINLCVSLYRPQCSSVFHRLCRQGSTQTPTHSTATHPRKSTLSPRGKQIFIVITTLCS